MINKIIIALTIVICLCSCADNTNCNRKYMTQKDNVPFSYIEEFEYNNHSYIVWCGYSYRYFSVTHNPDCKCFKK